MSGHVALENYCVTENSYAENYFSGISIFCLNIPTGLVFLHFLLLQNYYQACIFARTDFTYKLGLAELVSLLILFNPNSNGVLIIDQ